MDKHSKLLIILAAISFFLASSCVSQKHESIVKAMCEYIPDGSLRDDAEFHMTPSYFRACSEAIDAPSNGFEGPVDEEFLYYFVQGNDPSELRFNVRSLKTKGDSIIAKVTIEHVYDGVELDYVDENDKVVHTVRLVKNSDSEIGNYLLDNFDNTKQECLDYIKKMRSQYQTGEIERYFRSEGATSRDINNFRRSVQAFYAKYGRDSDTDNSTSNLQSISSSNDSYQSISFSSAMDVDAYLRGRRFTDSDGNTMSFTSSTEMSVNGTVITGAMRITDYNTTQAILSGVSPYGGGTVRIRVDAERGTITNIDEPDEVFRLSGTKSGGINLRL